MRPCSLLLLSLLCTLPAAAQAELSVAPPGAPVATDPLLQAPEPTAPALERFSLHFSLAVAAQGHPGFGARYSGVNSLQQGAELETAFVTGVQFDALLWSGAELIFDPEMSGGRGMSRSVGIAAFPSGLVYRVGDPAPAVYLARLLLRQTIGLGGGRAAVAAGANQVAGTRDRDALTFSVGRLSVTDVLDGNALAHDAASQFFDWALIASGAWDYPADTRGYTWGAFADLSLGDVSLRGGAALLPKSANGLDLEWDPRRSFGLAAEGELRWENGLGRGAGRLLGYYNRAPMGSYAQAIAVPGPALDVASTRAPGRTKTGLALSFDQKISPTLGAFLRASFNDGANETWAFTEIDRSLAAGLVHDRELLGRPLQMGAALVVNGLSAVHRQYLERGGAGFLLGDGALDYGLEVLGDVYARLQLTEFFEVSAIWQPVLDPGYNRDRGPVQVFSLRVRVSM